MNELEQWRPIPGYEGSYEVSSLGRVRSLDRIDARGNRAYGRVLIPGVQSSGHLRVSLCWAGIVTRRFVHGLVLEAFVGPRPAGMESCHNDGDPTNNVVSNLRWDSKSSNARDRRRHGTDARAARTHCPAGHEYVNSNTYYNALGWRRCRTCVLAIQRTARARLAMAKASA